ncbi:MAG: NAD/NADP octopine/nopaline dehydrogenase family protein [Butyricicoccus sp.]|nr:NAD/NADP octopine/nopaline dehydrogenase family protein [Butyricicoccus sp.]
MIKKITVVGAGSTGHAAAAIYSMKGFEVTLFDGEKFASRLANVEAQDGIQLRGKVRGIGKVAKITTCVEEAIPDAELIAVHVMSPRHEEVARTIAPYLRDGQHILIVPGNLGAFVFHRVFREMGVFADVTVTEQEGNLCPCRLTGEAEVTVGMPLKPKRIASLPASDTGKVIQALEGVWEFKANRNVFEGALNANNVVMHIGTTVLSASKIESMGEDFILFQHGFTQAGIRVGGLIRDERMAVIEALGFEEHANPLGMYEKVTHPDRHPEISVFRTLAGPDCIDHRYLTEDCSCGAAILLSFAARLGLSMPTLEAFVRVAGILTQRDYIAEGRTLENLGFSAGMSVSDIMAAV